MTSKEIAAYSQRLGALSDELARIDAAFREDGYFLGSWVPDAQDDLLTLQDRVAGIAGRRLVEEQEAAAERERAVIEAHGPGVIVVES